MHQARVATRRLRSDLRTFAPLLDDAWRAETRAELERLADALEAVRDNDVLEMRLVGELGAAWVEPEAAARLLAVLDQQGSVERRALVDVPDDARTSSLLSELRRAATDPPTTRATRAAR